MYMVYDGKKPEGSFSINWLKSGKSMVPYSVTFFDFSNTVDLLFGSKVDMSVKAKLEIDMMGASIVYYIPVIAAVVNSGKYDMSDKECKYRSSSK